MKLKMAPTLIALALAAAGVLVQVGHMPTVWMILAKTLTKTPPR